MTKSANLQVERAVATSLSVGAVSMLALLVVLATACRQAPPPTDAPIEEVEITLPPDALVNPEDDEQAVRYEGLSGQLPPDFPVLPLPSETTVIDQEISGVAARIHLLVPEHLEKFATTFPTRLAEAGWIGPSTLAAGPAVFRHGEETVTLAATEEGPSTALVVEY